MTRDREKKPTWRSAMADRLLPPEPGSPKAAEQAEHWARLAAEEKAWREGENPGLGRTTAEVREQILTMFKRANSKYAKPFSKERLAVLSVMGGNWEEYGQIVLQMAILDTLLSIEEKLERLAGSAPETPGLGTTGPDGREPRP